MKKRWRNRIIILLLIIPCAELAARIVGWSPIVQENFNVEVTPKHWLVGDSLFGLQLNPGSYSITLEETLKFKATHTGRGTRKIVADGEDRREVHIFGCSFTYGYGVNDDQVFANLLQEKHNDLRFVNFGVPGYGTVQSIQLLDREIGEGSFPTHAVLVYSEVHPERNALANSYRRALKIGFTRSNTDVEVSMSKARFPYRTIDDSEIHYSHWDDIYSNWLGRESLAIVHALQSTIEREVGEEELTAVTEDLFSEFIHVCMENSIVPIIVNLDDARFHERYSDVLERSEVETVDIGFDFTDKKLTNLPYDSHPNAGGHEMIAEKIDKALSRLLDE